MKAPVLFQRLSILAFVSVFSFFAAIAEDQKPDSADKDFSAELPRIAPKTPDEAVKSFRLKSGFHIELVASEPLIRSPMAMDFDEFGRAFVVELPEYNQYGSAKPHGKGAIKLLEDTNGDGRYDVLEVETRHFKGPRAFDLSGIPLHEDNETVIKERIFLDKNDKDLLHDEMTVIDNALTGRHPRFGTGPIAEMLRLPRVRREEAEHRAEAEKILAFVELERYRDEYVESLPFGIQKIVGFARALASKPAMLLLDEPSAGLTREEREDLAHFILKTKEELGICIIWIEHDMQMVADLADRILVLDAGRTIALGSPQEVLRNDAVIRAYLGVATQP